MLQARTRESSQLVRSHSLHLSKTYIGEPQETSTLSFHPQTKTKNGQGERQSSPGEGEGAGEGGGKEGGGEGGEQREGGGEGGEQRGAACSNAHVPYVVARDHFTCFVFDDCCVQFVW